MGHFGKLTSISDLPNEKQLTSYVRKAAELNERGVQKKRTPRGATEGDGSVGPEIILGEKREGSENVRGFQLQPQKRIRRMDHRRETRRNAEETIEDRD